jgi:hypothetical protein
LSQFGGNITESLPVSSPHFSLIRTFFVHLLGLLVNPVPTQLFLNAPPAAGRDLCPRWAGTVNSTTQIRSCGFCFVQTKKINWTVSSIVSTSLPFNE